MFWSELGQLFLSHHEAFSKPRTVTSYATACRKLLAHFDGEIAQTSPGALAAYVAKRRAHVQPQTLNAELRVLRALTRWGVAEGHIAAPPLRVRLLRERGKKTLQPLTVEQAQQLLRLTSAPWQRLLLRLALGTGLRLSELLHLERSDFDFAAGSLTVRAKGAWSPKSSRSRVVFLRPELLAEVERCPEGWLFATSRGVPRGDAGVIKALGRVFKRAGLYVPHSVLHLCRHSYATTLLHAGVDIQTVSDLLGHRAITTTALYSHPTEASRRAAVERLPY